MRFGGLLGWWPDDQSTECDDRIDSIEQRQHHWERTHVGTGRQSNAPGAANDAATTDDPAADQANTANESAGHQSTADDSTADDSTAHDPTAHDPTAHDSTADDSTADESTAHESTDDPQDRRRSGTIDDSRSRAYNIDDRSDRHGRSRVEFEPVE
jgi:hypothetical protein